MMKKNLYNNIYQRQHGGCAYCGCEGELVFAHILPKNLPNNFYDDDNLILVCRFCNTIHAGKPFIAQELKEIVFNTLNANSNFSDVKFVNPKNDESLADISASEKINRTRRKIAVTIRTFSNFTEQRVDEIISSIKSKTQDNVKQVFLFPGYISKEDDLKFRKNEIEVWDLEKLSQKFEKEFEDLSSKEFIKLFSSKFRSIDKEESLINDLKSIIPGKSSWSKYQQHIRKVLEYLFEDKLSSPIHESSDEFKINRRDFILRNYSELPFWKYLRERYAADFIVIDAKNYTDQVTKKEIIQIANYLKTQGTGLFAIIISRNGEKKNAYLTRREKWFFENKMIIILSDDDIEKMILAKKSSNDPEEIIKQRIEDFRLKV